jgi:ATP/maltotriose-dependent transcriptional regulator MalT
MLVEAGIFVEPLEGDGGWFRYHELFRTLLQRRLRATHDPLAVQAMNERAQTWFQAHGLPEDARRYACSGSDKPWAMPPQPSRYVEHATALTAQFASALAATPGQVPPSPELNVRELVTFREMDVLLLLNKRLTNKEIARVRGISPDTGRQHSVNIYRKLGVENRRQAIVRANALGAFAPEHQQGTG